MEFGRPSQERVPQDKEPLRCHKKQQLKLAAVCLLHLATSLIYLPDDQKLTVGLLGIPTSLTPFFSPHYILKANIPWMHKSYQML